MTIPGVDITVALGSRRRDRAYHTLSLTAVAGELSGSPSACASASPAARSPRPHHQTRTSSRTRNASPPRSLPSPPRRIRSGELPPRGVRLQRPRRDFARTADTSLTKQRSRPPSLRRMSSSGRDDDRRSCGKAVDTLIRRPHDLAYRNETERPQCTRDIGRLHDDLRRVVRGALLRTMQSHSTISATVPRRGRYLDRISTARMIWHRRLRRATAEIVAPSIAPSA